jgi:ABC-type glycerol-3-phosphate transport system permease component
MIVPFQALMIPFISIFAQFVAYNNRAALIFFYQGFGIALSVFLYHGFISKIPMDLDEAAAMDGASDMTIFWRIMFPMLRPVTATVAIVNALWIWNDFLFGVVFASGDAQPITVALNNLVNTSTGVKEYNVDMAAAMIAGLPTLLVYVLAGKYFLRGLTAGAVKG